MNSGKQTLKDRPQDEEQMHKTTFVCAGLTLDKRHTDGNLTAQLKTGSKTRSIGRKSFKKSTGSP
jgi:hypothetical protein